MELDDGVFDDEADDLFEEPPCIAREECTVDLLADSPEGCLYCRISSLDGDE